MSETTNLPTPADESTDQPTDSDLEAATGVELPRSFLVEGQGPVTVVRDRGDVVERTEGDLTISRRVETLEEFGEFWHMRNLKHWKRRAIRTVLEDQEDDSLQYVIDEDQLEVWDVLVDGHVQAYFGVAEVIREGVDVEGLDAPSEFRKRVAHTYDPDDAEIVEGFARDLKTSELWGPGIRIAELAVKYAQREDLESYTRALLDQVSDDQV